MCYHQFLGQVEEYESSGKLLAPLPCRICDPKAYKAEVERRRVRAAQPRRRASKASTLK